MKLNRRQTIATLAVAPLASCAQAADASRLTDDDIPRLLKETTPDPDRPWRTIPWKIALLDAQRTAATQRKPIFIWAMDGHPLGCT